LHVYAVHLPGGEAAGRPGAKAAAADSICTVSLPKPPPGLTEAQRGRLWLAAAWAPPGWMCEQPAQQAGPGRGAGPAASGGACVAGNGAAVGSDPSTSAGHSGLDRAGAHRTGAEGWGAGGRRGPSAFHWLIASGYGGACSLLHWKLRRRRGRSANVRVHRRGALRLRAPARGWRGPTAARAHPRRPHAHRLLHPHRACARACCRARPRAWPGRRGRPGRDGRRRGRRRRLRVRACRRRRGGAGRRRCQPGGRAAEW